MALTEEGIIHVPGMLSRWVRLGSGAKAHFMTSGETGPAVVLLHGGIIGSSGTAGWRFMAPFLGANGFRVYCPDMPGFGLSETREEYWPRDPSSHVRFVHEFTTALCLDRFHLAGNSMGCYNAVNYMVAHPERVTSFALIAGAIGDIVPAAKRSAANIPPFDGSVESMRTMMETIIHRPEAMNDDLMEMRTLSANRHRPDHERFFEAMTRAFSETTPDLNLLAKLRTRDRLDALTIPGIYLYGQDDVLLPVESAHPQEDALPNVQFFYPADTGHQGQTDQPELFNQVFLEFFRDGKVSWPTAQRAGVSTRRPVNPERVAVEQASQPAGDAVAAAP